MKNLNYLRRNRKNFSKTENKQIVFSFLNETYLNSISLKKKVTFKISPKNRCLFTSKKLSLFSELRFSRHQFNHLAGNGMLIGIKKAVW